MTTAHNQDDLYSRTNRSRSKCHAVCPYAADDKLQRLQQESPATLMDAMAEKGPERGVDEHQVLCGSPRNFNYPRSANHFICYIL
jgi:hypothetical protein